MSTQAKTRQSPPLPSAEALRGAIAQIEDHAGHNVEALLEVLKQGGGLKIASRRDGSVRLALHGITAASSDGVVHALNLWARKARRTLLGVA